MTEYEDEIEAKFAKAQYYSTLINTQLLEESESDPVAAEVEDEIYEFLRSQRLALMGMGSPKRGRKPAVREVVRPKPRRVTPEVQPEPVRRRKLGQTTQNQPEPPKQLGYTVTDEYITVETELKGGGKLTKMYVKAVADNDTEFYLGYTVDTKGASEPDGNKYRLTTDGTGNNIFTVINQQSIPDKYEQPPQTKAGIVAAMNAAATKHMQAVPSSADMQALIHHFENS